MATAATPPRSGFSEALPAEPDQVESRSPAEDAAPDWDLDSSTVDAMSLPFRDGEDTTAEKAVEKAIEMVVLEPTIEGALPVDYESTDGRHGPHDR